MKSKIFIISGFLALFFIAYGLAYYTKKYVDFGAQTPLTIRSKGGDFKFMVEIADTRKKRAGGLMYRKNIPDNAGMLFVYNKSKHRTMWMKNTYISLDILFVDDMGRIVNISHNANPMSKTPVKSHHSVNAVLEIKGGKAASLGIEVGDIIIHPFFARQD